MDDRNRQEELELDLRATSDNLILAAEQLISLEGQKRQVDITSEDFRSLAAQIEGVARDMWPLTASERRRADLLAAMRDPIGKSSVGAIPASPALADVLDRWRSAERRLASLRPGTVESREAALDVEDAAGRLGHVSRSLVASIVLTVDAITALLATSTAPVSVRAAVSR